MKPPVGPTVWAVHVRRVATTTVLVKHTDPAEARAIALREASDWDEAVSARAYTLEGRPSERVWTSEGWLYPETELFNEGEK